MSALKMGNATLATENAGSIDISYGALPAGVPVQMQVKTFNTKYTHTANPSTTWSDTGYYVNISPFFSNSKILVRLTTCITHHVSTSTARACFRRYIGSTHGATSPLAGVHNGDGATMGSYDSGSGTDNGQPFPMVWYDTHAQNAGTQITYKVFLAGNLTSGASSYVQMGTSAAANASDYDIITTDEAMEISG